MGPLFFWFRFSVVGFGLVHLMFKISANKFSLLLEYPGYSSFGISSLVLSITVYYV